jgi:hypothetical protein
MPLYLRKYLVLVYILFFIGFAGFLLINSFGYRLNTTKRVIENSASVYIKTAPSGAAIVTNPGNRTTISNADLTLSNAGEISISLSKEGYATDKFNLYYSGLTNSATFLDRIYLMPTSSSTIAEYPSASKPLVFLSPTQLITQKNNSWYIDTISTVGITGTNLIQTTGGLPTELPNFKPIGDQIFWDSKLNLVLAEQAGSWNLYQLQNLGFKVISAVANQQKLLLYTDTKELWEWNYKTSPVFVDSEVSGLTYTETPRTIWLWKNNWINTINLSNPISVQINQKSSQVVDDIFLTSTNYPFVIKQVYQGFVYLLGTDLYYRGDFENANFTLLDSDVLVFTSTNDSVYWSTSKQQLVFSNIRTQNRKLLTNYPEISSISSLLYDDYWSRLMIILPTKTDTIWHDNNRENQTITQYVVTPWLANSTCTKSSSLGSVYCINQNTIQIYINRNLLF